MCSHTLVQHSHTLVQHSHTLAQHGQCVITTKGNWVTSRADVVFVVWCLWCVRLTNMTLVTHSQSFACPSLNVPTFMMWNQTDILLFQSLIMWSQTDTALFHFPYLVDPLVPLCLIQYTSHCARCSKMVIVVRSHIN